MKLDKVAGTCGNGRRWQAASSPLPFRQGEIPTVSRRGEPNENATRPANFSGGEYSNTPPATLQSVDISLGNSGAMEKTAISTGGEDWFEVSWYLSWNRTAFNQVRYVLDAMQEEAKGRKPTDGFGCLPGSKGIWKVHPHGCRLGEKGKGPIMKWVFERDGIIFGLADRELPHDTMPSGFVRMTGEAILALGSAESMWNAVVKWFGELGAEVTKNALSRVDLCLDMPNVSVTPFVDALRDGRVIRKSVNRGEFGEEVHGKGHKDTGITMGKGTMVRVYDKAVECRDLAKRAWMIHKRWGGQDCDQAARVEFQLRRTFLTCSKRKPGKGLNRPPISTVEDYFDKRADLVDYLVNRWVRFVKVGYDKRHPERAKSLPEWAAAVAGFVAWAGNADPIPFVPLPRRLATADDLVRQARGCLEAAAARLRKNFAEPYEFVNFCGVTLEEASKFDDEIHARIQNRMNDIALVEDEQESLVDQRCTAPF